MNFIDEQHENAYAELAEKMHTKDCYHLSFAYLITLDRVCREHITEIFDIKDDSIKSSCLEEPWITGSSKRTITLAFALWNDFNKADVNNIFGYSNEYNIYYTEALKIRFGF